jgi:hypothetical protein
MKRRSVNLKQRHYALVNAMTTVIGWCAIAMVLWYGMELAP